MFDQQGGFSPADFDTASSQLRNCRSADEVAELIKRFPVFSSPFYHARLRQIRLQFEASSADQPEGFFAWFLSLYDCFFTLQHQRVHYTAVEHGKASAAAAVPYVPPLIATVMALVDGHDVTAGPMHALPADLDALRAELSQLIGRQAVLPAYEPSPGALFSLLVLRCLACGRQRLAAHCHAADLRGDAAWRQRFAQGQINGDSCPNCRALRSEVVRPWICELPHPQDPLLMLSCLCVVANHERIYLPPPGTPRHAEHDRIYEIRLEMMSRQLGGSWAHDDRAGVIHTDGIAYGADEMEARLSINDERGRAGTEYEDTLQALVEKLSSGTLPLQDAQCFLKEGMTGPMLTEWPLVQADGGEPYEVLARRLIFLACVESRGLPASTCLGAHCSVAHALLDLHETGLAEMRLISARDLLPAVDREAREDAEIACLTVQEGVHVARGEHTQANAVRAQIQAMIAARTGDNTPSARLLAAELRTNDGLALQRELRLAEALQNIAANVEALAELEPSLQKDDPTALPRAHRARSGNLANLAGVLVDVANGQELMEDLMACGGDFRSLPEHAIATVRQLGSAQRLMDLQAELCDRLPPVLALHLPQDNGVDGLRRHAARLLEEAIALGQGVGDHEYLGIQWMQLARIRSLQGQTLQEDAALTAALRHSSLAANDPHVASICWEMALNAQARGQSAALLDALERGLRAALRGQVKSGVAPGMLGEMGGLALSAAESDEERLRAIAISEGEKNMPLARSMNAGAALAGPQDSSPQAGELAQLVARRERLRLQVMWGELEGSEARAQVEALDRQVEQLRQEAAYRDPRYAAWHNATFLEPPGAQGLAALLARLGPSATLVGFTVAGPRAYAYAAWDGGCVTTHVSYDGSAAQEEDDPCSQAPWLRALWQALAPRLDVEIDGHRLLISTCEEVAAVAWVTLPVRGKPMAATTAPSMLHGLGMLSVCLDRPQPGLGPALVLGAPDRPDQVALPAAATEADAVAALLRKAGVAVTGALTEHEATAVRLMQEAPACRLLHLACHAEPPSAGRAARLLLAPSVLQGDSGDLDDERIVAGLALQPGALVVMASCDSSKFGDAQRFINRGLVPAWLVVGASTVLGTLWPVADAAAREMLEAFYRHLLAGKRPSEALRLAQSDAANGRYLNPALRDPRHWAGYQIHGLG